MVSEEQVSASGGRSWVGKNEVKHSLAEFVKVHGAGSHAVLQPIGRAGVRITLVGTDGILGDRVVADGEQARAAVEATDGLELADGWDRELTSIATPREGHYRKMAGWVANT